VSLRRRARVAAPLASRVAPCLFALVACSDAAQLQQVGAAYVVAAAAVAAPPADAHAARVLAETSPPHVFRGSSKGKSFGYIALFGRAAGSMQVGLVISERSDDGARVVYADQLDSHPRARHAAGVVTPPPGADWPRPCRTYELRFASSAGALAVRRVLVPGCAKAIEDLRGRALFHVGKGGPPLYSFEGSLRAYKKKLGARPLLKAPLGRAAFFLGWKAAFRGPANVSAVRVRLFAPAEGKIASETDVPLDRTWDSLAGGWEIPAEPSWPKAGLAYELVVYAPKSGVAPAEGGTVGVMVAPEWVLARGHVVVAEDDAATTTTRR